MKAVSFLLAALTLALATTSLQPAAHAADEKADAKKKKKKPDEAKPPAPAKPADKKPEEKKPDEAKPPAPAKPAVSTPPKPAEAKPAEAKPAEAKPAEPKPVVAPEPKPVVTPEPAPSPQALDIETLRKDRGDRRKQTVARSRQLWGPLLKDERGNAELKRHSFLIAALRRVLAIAESKKDNQTVETVNALLAKEDERHAKKMNTLRAATGGPQ